MSHTDRDRPYWLVTATEGVTEHDHRFGVCRESTLPLERRRAAGLELLHHAHDCPNRSGGTYGYRFDLGTVDRATGSPGCQLCANNAPTCDFILPAGHRLAGKEYWTPAERWWRSHTTHNPARAENRDRLGRAAGEYNHYARAGVTSDPGWLDALPEDADLEDNWEPATDHGSRWEAL